MTLRTHIILSSLVSLVLIAVIVYRARTGSINYENKQASKQISAQVSKQTPPKAEKALPTQSAAAEQKSASTAAETPKATDQATTKPATPEKPQIFSMDIFNPGIECLVNGDFKKGQEKWTYHAGATQENCSFLTEGDTSFARIDNPSGKLYGIRQPVGVQSGTVYRLSAKIRSAKTEKQGEHLGARLAFYTPGYKEKQVVWFSHSQDWVENGIVITNVYNGAATIYVQLGYMKTPSCADVSNISLVKAKDSNLR